MLCAIVPQVSRWRSYKPLVGLGLAAPAVAVGPGLFSEVRRISGIAPLVSVFRNLAVAVDVVKDHGLTYELVGVWCYLFAKECELGIAVSLPQVSKYLIKCPILSDDVQHVFDLGKDFFLNSG